MARVCKCGGIADETGCKRCKRGGSNENRENSHKRGYTRQWYNYSVQFRTTWPLCAHCERNGKTTAIAPGDGFGQVDHIIRPGKSQELFWAPENHQGLCRECHGKKTTAEDSGNYTMDMIRQDQEQRQRQLDDDE